MTHSLLCQEHTAKSIRQLIEKPIDLDRPVQTKLAWKSSKARINLCCIRDGLLFTGIEKCQIDKCIDITLLEMMQHSEETARVAWGRMYWLYQKNLYVCVLACGCKEGTRAEDIVNNVFLDFYENLRQKSSREEEFRLRDASLKTFLCNIAKRRWIDITRSGDYKRVTKGDPPERPDPLKVNVFEKLRRLVALYRVIFPDPQDNCLQLLKYAYLENMLYKEILQTNAGQKYHSEGAVANRISHCMKVVRAKLQEAKLMEEFKDIIGGYKLNLKANKDDHGKV
jgi:DNA-directed RNA polymerase specialized sigma24 family protein